jgi:hypothetical protein
MRRHVIDPEHGPLAALAAQVDRLAHDLDTARSALTAVSADAAHHGAALTRLADLITTTAPGPGPGTPDPTAGGPAGPVVVDWMSVTDPAVAVPWLSTLSLWVDRVWAWYEPIPGCWAWHPAVVAELGACLASWDAATGPGAGPDGPSAWHDRWRPGTADRTRAALKGCARTGLHAVGTGRYHAAAEHLDELAAWWATTASTPTHTDQATPPGLTPATR